MSKISAIQEAMDICKAANIAMFIWGHRGIGKSASVRQKAAKHGWGFVDLRCSQMEASDIRGLPARGEDGRTHYLPPAELPRGDMSRPEIVTDLLSLFGVKDGADAGNVDALNAKLNDLLAKATPQQHRAYNDRYIKLQPRFEEGLLFLDEVNRGQDDVQQALFELVLDRKVGAYALPPGWGIVAAGNFSEGGGYNVNTFTDSAFIDRFCHVTMSAGESTLEEWIQYMSDTHGSGAADVIEFASQNVDHLDGKLKPGDLGFNIEPSRRSWEAVVRVDKVVNERSYSPEAKHIVLAGLLGSDIATSYINYSCPVKPRLLIERGVKAYERELAKLGRNALTGLMWGLVSFCKNKVDEEETAEFCIEFGHYLLKKSPDKDIVTAFFRALISNGSEDRTRTAIISNPQLAQIMAKFRGKDGGKKTFADYLCKHPEFQAILSDAAWGSSFEDKDSGKKKK